MNKKLMSLGLVSILSVSLMVGCDSSNNDDDTITIKHVDENGNTIKKEKVTKEEAKRIEENQKQQTTKDNTSKRETNKQQPKQHKQQPKEDSTTEDNRNLDDVLYGNAARGTCPDCGRNGMVFNHGDGLKCAYCGFYDPYYYLPEEPDQDTSDDNKDDEYVPDDNNDYDDYDETQDYEESPSEPVEEDMN